MTPFPKAAAFLTLIAGPAMAAPVDDAAFQRIAAEVFTPVIAASDIPGMAVGVVIDGRTHVWTTGLADRARGVPVTEETVFELGSISKLFTVALAGLAAEEGRLDLDAAVSSARPDLGGGAFDRITLSDLAMHATGGMPLQVPEEITGEDGLNRWLADWSPEGTPGKIRAYSNVSIGLLGQIAGTAMAKDYRTAVETRLFPELGLEHTYIEVPKAAPYAWGYRKERAVHVSPGLLDDEAYGVKSTAPDMLRFLQAHLEGDDTAMGRALARTRAPGYDTAHFAQGMIWEGYGWPADPQALAKGNGPQMAMEPQPITPHDGPAPRFLTKTGSTGGFGAYVALLPEADLGVVVLANRTWPNPERAAATVRMIEALLAED